jgi:hypothetical protein
MSAQVRERQGVDQRAQAERQGTGGTTVIDLTAGDGRCRDRKLSATFGLGTTGKDTATPKISQRRAWIRSPQRNNQGQTRFHCGEFRFRESARPFAQERFAQRDQWRRVRRGFFGQTGSFARQQGAKKRSQSGPRRFFGPPWLSISLRIRIPYHGPRTE